MYLPQVGDINHTTVYYWCHDEAFFPSVTTKYDKLLSPYGSPLFLTL